MCLNNPIIIYSSVIKNILSKYYLKFLNTYNSLSKTNPLTKIENNRVGDKKLLVIKSNKNIICIRK